MVQIWRLHTSHEPIFALRIVPLNKVKEQIIRQNGAIPCSVS